MTPADRLAEAAAVAAEKHAEFFILLKSADYTTEEKRALQVPLFNELGVAMRALREELAAYRAAPDEGVARRDALDGQAALDEANNEIVRLREDYVRIRTDRDRWKTEAVSARRAFYALVAKTGGEVRIPDEYYMQGNSTNLERRYDPRTREVVFRIIPKGVRDEKGDTP